MTSWAERSAELERQIEPTVEPVRETPGQAAIGWVKVIAGTAIVLFVAALVAGFV